MIGKELQTIIKLNDMTKDGRIKWSSWRIPIDSLAGLERLLGNAFMTTVRGKDIRIYKYESRHYYEENEFEWVPHFRLEFIDNHGKAGWVFPEELALEDLYDSILYKHSGTSEFFESFLGEE